MRKGFRKTAAAAILMVVFSSCGGDRETPTQLPIELSGAASGWNVILLSLDTVRADRLGAYGYTKRTTSPNIDGLIGKGVRFQQTTAPRAATWPSLGSVLTGLYPVSHGVFTNGYNLADDIPTLPKILQEAGYQTGAFVCNMCKANHQGWDELFCSDGRDKALNKAALEWMDTIDRSRPFLLWTHYFAAHGPYQKGGDLAKKKLDKDYEGFLAPKKGVLDSVMQDPIALGERDLHHLGAMYDAAIMATDSLVGKLIDTLGRGPWLDRTIIVFLADHGEELYEHNAYLYHACSVYQSTLHVPLAVVAPSLIPGGRAIDGNVELIDVTPTILDLLGVGIPESMQGESLVPYLERQQPSGPQKPAFSEYGSLPIRTVLDDGWKLVDNPRGKTPQCFTGTPENFYPIAKVELYNLNEDGGETRNVAAENPEKVTELRTLIQQRFQNLPDRRDRQNVSDQVKERLKALGYVTDEQ